MRTFIGLDIETRGIPEAAERLWRPAEYKAPGNIKDPVKLAEHKTKWEANLSAEKAEFIERAALSPLTGSIVIIGLVNDEGVVEYLEGTEREIITRFWGIVNNVDHSVTKFVFWSGAGAASEAFDMDFIVTRSRILRIKIPGTVRNGRFYGTRFIDLASEFLLYKNQSYLSLTNVAEILGLFAPGAAFPAVTRKADADEVTGATFAKNYDDEATRGKALGYLRNDLLLLFHVAQAIL